MTPHDLSSSHAHTPGPWRIKQSGFTYFRDITILALDNIGDAVPVAGAFVRNSLHPYGKTDKARAEIEANARLIAAAPELLEALESITRRFDIIQDLGKGDLLALEKARAAIEKATARA